MNLQLFINVDGVERAAEPVVRPPHLEQLCAGHRLPLPLARQDHVLAALHRLKMDMIFLEFHVSLEFPQM